MKFTNARFLTKYIFTDVIREILLLPFWWYTIGLAVMVSWCTKSVGGASRFFGLDIWVKNLFVPMYGETGFVGRAISFFIRLVMVIIRGIATIGWMICAIILFILYLLVFPISVLGILYHSFGLFF